MCVCLLQVFGVDEQEGVCVSRLGGADQRERLTAQRSGTGDRGKPGRMETEVQKRKAFKFKPKSCQVSRPYNLLSFFSCIFHAVFVQVITEELMVGGPRWVSQWATLAASHIRTDPEGSGGESHVMLTEERGTYVKSRAGIRAAMF